MEVLSIERYTPRIQQELLARYGISLADCQPLDGFESFIYQYQLGGQKFVLRIGHSQHRRPSEVEGEIEWINYLADHGVSVPRVLTSINGNLIEVVDDEHGGQFTATRFSWAPGKHQWELDIWGPELFQKIGDLLGRMHQLAIGFKFSSCSACRPMWDSDSEVNLRPWLPANDRFVADYYDQLTLKINEHQRQPNNFGLIHFDFHAGNYFVDGEKLTLFDFDDCCYHYFVADIAMVMFYAISHHRRDLESLNEAATLFKALVKGYKNHHTLHASDWALIPLLMKQRELLLYAMIHRSSDVSAADSLDDWSKSFLQGRREKLAEQVAYIDLDFVALVDELQ